jgi:hypothetical protein
MTDSVEIKKPVVWNKGFIEAVEGQVAESIEDHVSEPFRWLTNHEKEKILEAGKDFQNDFTSLKHLTRFIVIELRNNPPLEDEELSKLLINSISGTKQARERYANLTSKHQ